MSNKRVFEFLGLAFWVVLTFSIAAFASQFEPGEWYKSIAKPIWTPPGWLFGPVWGILYFSMSISAWLVWRQRPNTAVTISLMFYLTQLALNGLWSWLFFGRQWIGLALIDLIVLVITVAIMIVMFIRISKAAGFILLPYLFWISFAAALNFEIWRIN